jgi:hypothetical protein
VTERGGLVLATAAGLAFVPATTAVSVVQLGPLADVPGLPRPALGVALADGRVATVISLASADAPAPSTAVLCEIDGDLVTFVADEVLAVGSFPTEAGVVRYGAALVPDLDARGIYAELEGTLWAARAVRLARRRATMQGGEA